MRNTVWCGVSKTIRIDQCFVCVSAKAFVNAISNPNDVLEDS